jgi:rod shape-determining protein MreD
VKGLILHLLCGLFFMLLQTTIFPRFLPPEIRPNLLLILVIYLGLSESFLRAAFLTLLLGALQDVFCGTTLGLYATVQLTIFLLVRLFSGRLNIESRPLLLGLIGIGTILQTLLLGFFLTTFAEAGPVLGILLPDLPFQVVSNLLAGWVLLVFLLKLQPMLGTRQGMAGLSYQSKHHGA